MVIKTQSNTDIHLQIEKILFLNLKRMCGERNEYIFAVYLKKDIEIDFSRCRIPFVSGTKKVTNVSIFCQTRQPGMFSSTLALFPCRSSLKIVSLCHWENTSSFSIFDIVFIFNLKDSWSLLSCIFEM